MCVPDFFLLTRRETYASTYLTSQKRDKRLPTRPILHHFLHWCAKWNEIYILYKLLHRLKVGDVKWHDSRLPSTDGASCDMFCSWERIPFSIQRIVRRGSATLHIAPCAALSATSNSTWTSPPRRLKTASLSCSCRRWAHPHLTCLL